MTRRSLLLTPGDWTHTTALPATFEYDDPLCVFCLRMVELGWAHTASGSLACSRCLPDAWAGDGEAGRRAGERLAVILEAERKERNAIEIL